jgi:hypothetical protein
MGALLACDTPEMERIPTEEELRNWPVLQPFLLSPESLSGVYRNLDVDCVVFHYRSSLPTEQVFWQQVEQRAAAQRWSAASGGEGTYRTYQRLVPRGSMGFSSAEETRIGYVAGRVVVGYVQSDQWRETPRPVAEASEGRFAERNVWPKFKSVMSGGAG